MRTSWKIATAATVLAVMLSMSSGADARIYATGQAMSTLDKEQDVPLKEQARLWAEQLANSPDGAFAEWKGAWASTAALGPGTHSWLVLMRRGQSVVGYMIVYAKDGGGYVLGEYGIGEYPPFSSTILKSALTRLGLSETSMKATRLYIHPLLAAWQISGGIAGHGSITENHYTDAYSGEQLPIDAEQWAAAAAQDANANKHGVKNAHASISSAGAMASFDPYGRLPWLTQSPYSIAADPLSILSDALRDNSELRYVSKSFQGKMTYAWSVTGYSEWSGGELFISLDSEENAPIRRYIPASLLQSLGSFYL
ncbi:hypothetical protein PAT3040_00602 [Paenibacillus agaridevorans]|uniref:Uncharacterized protein n=1 Tax=Paenibacillus agaridevorans TaxID=171404 RepID=A0A2R5EKE3_9BACL|nr:hypothetical protein [Paenibacillus agaridevorans]GBG06099.1 hypothetical protein PAT3040_00602 [Paenibacillus agaridevorans]